MLFLKEKETEVFSRWLNKADSFAVLHCIRRMSFASVATQLICRNQISCFCNFHRSGKHHVFYVFREISKIKMMIREIYTKRKTVFTLCAAFAIFLTWFFYFCLHGTIIIALPHSSKWHEHFNPLLGTFPPLRNYNTKIHFFKHFVCKIYWKEMWHTACASLSFSFPQKWPLSGRMLLWLVFFSSLLWKFTILSWLKRDMGGLKSWPTGCQNWKKSWNRWISVMASRLYLVNMRTNTLDVAFFPFKIFEKHTSFEFCSGREVCR